MAQPKEKEGWLRKKSHHVGLWHWRFFRCDNGKLLYWKHQSGAIDSESARGELPLRGIHAAAAPGGGPWRGCGAGRTSSVSSSVHAAPGGCRLLLRCADGAYDEELMAATPQDRDDWVALLNRESLRARAALPHVSPENFLKAKGLWEPLLQRAAGELAAGEGEATPSSAGPGAGASAGGTSAAAMLVSHTMSGPALLRLSDGTSAPRQGPLVVAGRRLLARKRDAAAVLETRVLLLSGRTLGAQGQWSGWQAQPPAVMPSGAGATMTTMQSEANGVVEFETLHAYSHRLDSSKAIASLPLLGCSAGPVEQCADGSGWCVRVLEGDGREEVVDAAGVQRRPGGWQSLGAPRQERWTLIFHSRERCEEWQRAIQLACSAAKAQEAGRRRTREEALAEYDADPAAWRRGARRRLAEAEESAAGAGAAVGLRMVIQACDEAWNDSEDLLDSALQQRPWRRDACEAVLQAALEPALACAGRAWARWGGELPPEDGRALLRWLAARRSASHRLGVVCPALNAAISGLSAELCLRAGERLWRRAAGLLVQELRVSAAALPRQVSQGTFAGSFAAGPAAAGTGLPVDLFGLVRTCLPEGQEPVELMANSRRVARYVIFEVQETLHRWLLGSHRQVAEDLLAGRRNAKAGARERVRPLPPGVWAWLERVAALARDMPGFQAQCAQLSDGPSDAEGSSGQGREPPAEERDELGRTALPREWSLGAEEERFARLESTLLWAACDAASLEWRRRVLSEAAAHDGLASLQEHLDGHLQGLRGMLGATLFEGLLRKLFYICFAALVVRLSRRRDLQAASQEAEELCGYFHAQAARAAAAAGPPPPRAGGSPLEGRAPAGQPPPWEFGLVTQALRMVTESLDQHPAASRRPSRAGTPQCGTPAERTLAPGCPGTPGTPGGPSPGGADLRGKALPHARGLSKLVRALQPCRQLPLAELAAWFGDGLGPPPGRFDELPPSDGFGGGYLPLRGEEVSAGFKTPPRSGSPCASPAVTFRSASFMSTGGRSASFLSTGGRSESFSSTGSRRRSSFSLFGRPSLDASRLQLPEPAPQSPPGAAEPPAPPAEPGRGARALLASGGEAGELRVEETGSYGAFCCVGLRPAGAGGREGEQPPGATAGQRRRWLQLARAGSRCPPVFEVLEGRPAEPEGPRAPPLACHKLGALREVALRSATELELTFAVEQYALGESFVWSPDVELRRYAVAFDCPSHLLRWRLVLEAWWQPPQGAAPLREQCPVVVLSSAAAAGEAGGPGFPQERLTRAVLEVRLGSLWCAVRPRLEAAVQEAAALRP